IEEELHGVNGSLISFISSYIEECESGVQEVSEGTIKNYRAHMSKLITYTGMIKASDLYFQDIDMPFYTRFCNMLADQGCTTPGIDSHIKRLKKFMRESLDRGLHINRIFETKEFRRRRARKQDKIYLAREEVEQLIALDCTKMPESYRRERDRWLISYFLLLRYSDTLNIRKDHFFELEGRIYYRNNAQKTKQTNYVPVSGRAWDILKRNEFNFGGANQVANRVIKELAKKAGIDTNVGGRPKYELISTHTARRSMATQLHQSGMDIRTIMQLGGWRSEAAIKAYLLSSDLQLAQQAAQNALFD
ncbi:MAG: tyrosine-type recombinase/integrase, partial [Bacteroidota bacterium]